VQIKKETKTRVKKGENKKKEEDELDNDSAVEALSPSKIP
jgi:hypothetical protein